MIRKEELMIGDWVVFHDSGYASDGTMWREERICQIDSIDEDVRVRWTDEDGEKETWPHVSLLDLSPIPLTPEILEKNGFRFDGSGQMSMMLATSYGDSGTRWSIYVGLKHKTIEAHCAPPVERKPGWRKSNKACLEACGCFVHELQHALRLCGIEKTIDI